MEDKSPRDQNQKYTEETATQTTLIKYNTFDETRTDTKGTLGVCGGLDSQTQTGAWLIF